jgi:pyridoxamine 5'-phosphate oxidase
MICFALLADGGYYNRHTAYQDTLLQYEDFRREYLAGGLSRDLLDDCPITQFESWLQQAVDGGLQDPTAMVLATVDASGMPWQRIVLLKGVSTKGFVFYTNYGSAKAEAIAREPRVSLHFPWNVLDRQVIVAGTVEKMSKVESLRYFASRPRESQLAAWASRQSRSISARAALEKEFLSMKNKFSKGEIPMPDFWGGYRVVPQRIEFWQGGAHRLHDRFLYTAAEDGSWAIDQLQP